MIFVAFGTIPIPFDRLAVKVDEIAGAISEPFVVQNGHTKYPFKNVVFYPFLTNDKMEQFVREASLIISHGGMGTITEALRMKKMLIVVPRNESEHNHSQLELAEELEKRRLVICVRDVDRLKEAMQNISGFSPRAITYEHIRREINLFLNSLNRN